VTQAGAEARRYGRTAGLLSLGVGATGLITYAYFSLAAHNLSKVQYGEIAVLWSAVFITVSTLYRPVEQLLSRTIAERQTHGQSIGQPMRVASTIQLGLGAAFAAAAVLLRGPLQDSLLNGNETLYWILIATVLAYAASYFARGFLAGSRRFPLYAGLIMSESISRTMFALLVAVGVTSGQTAVALGIVAAPCFSLIVVPFAFYRTAGTGWGARGDFPSGPSGEPRANAVGAGGAAAARPTAKGDPEFTLAHGSGFAAAVLVIMFSEQTFLNAGPLLIRGSEGAAAAGYIFNILMIARAPLQLFQAISTSLLPHLTNLRSRGEAKGEEAFRLSVQVTVLAVAAFGAVVAGAMALLGPHLMQLAFGNKFSYDRVALVIVSIGMGLYLCAVTLNQAALAQGQVRRASVCWGFCAVGFVVWNLLPALNEFRRVEVGFTVTAGVLCVLLYLLYRRPHARLEDLVAPGSPRELEATLAAADEGS
jgi:O-antigen/teichoic acid export membrane protein